MSRKAQKPLPPFHVGDDYKILHGLGEGAYGTVVAALHKPTNREVAIKKVLPFEHTLFCLRTLRELKLLKFFSETCVNENIISILDIVKPASYDEFKEIYFIQELMQTDLHRVIRTQQLTDDHCQYFVYQTLRALKTMHSADIVHRDLKPANLLLNANCDLKVCDFGLARSTRSTNPGGKEAGLMTEYVATRWYRAPEIMLSFKMYTKAIDIWAVGCILAELLNGRPLFPGRDYGHQLDLILDVIGTPTLEEFYGITSRRSRDYIRALPIRKRRPFTALFPKASPDAIDFLQKTLVSPSVVCRAPVSLRSSLGAAAVAIVPCTMRIRAPPRNTAPAPLVTPPRSHPLALPFCSSCVPRVADHPFLCAQTFDPKKRLTVDQALEHPYLAAYHDPEDEPAVSSLDPEYFEFDYQELNKEDLKKRLFEEVMSFQSSI
uniref:Mitogen-activated protein kinase n=1 Tax=Ganoderma lucidum TaxID=5315 RepID=V5W4Q5_GANLU|nr:mitogen-activated protein kinase [Ganoderma lucidum]